MAFCSRIGSTNECPTRTDPLTRRRDVTPLMAGQTRPLCEAGFDELMETAEVKRSRSGRDDFRRLLHQRMRGSQDITSADLPEEDVFVRVENRESTLVGVEQHLRDCQEIDVRTDRMNVRVNELPDRGDGMLLIGRIHKKVDGRLL